VSPGAGRAYSSEITDFEDQLFIDTSHVGMVIGRGGETLRRIERESGARVQFSPGHSLSLS
jgi:far upstream element-binding protein